VTALTELVDLPDPAVHPLVHPLDLPQARRAFRLSWFIAASTSPAVGLCAAGIVWFASRNALIPLLAAAVIVGCGRLASRYHLDRAWAFIPRKRQDRRRRPPLRWEIGSGLVLAVVLAAALLLVAVRLDRPDIAVSVREYTFGMGAAAGVLVIIDLVDRVTRRRSAERGQALSAIPVVVALAASIAVCYRILFGPSGAGSPGTLWWGAATMLVAGAGVGIWRYRQTAARPTGDTCSVGWPDSADRCG
jgi:hypothetical protein